jgi:DNA helicase-2/ATP-dependent DNA helicase PcrA
MEAFENLIGFLEHVSLVMDAEGGEAQDAVQLMTLHSAKGLEFDTVFLPGWEEGLFPHQRSLDEQGRAGLEEERRLAHVGLTRARHRVRIYFAANRRIRGLWNSTLPSRFLDELPEAHVEVVEQTGGFGERRFGERRFGGEGAFASRYDTPGWQRAQARKREEARGGGFEEGRGFGERPAGRWVRAPVIDGEVVGRSGAGADFKRGERVFHIKFGYGEVRAVDGNKLTVQFDKAGEKRVVASFVERV